MGLDLVGVEAVRTALARFGANYLDRLFTPAEQRCWGRDPAGLAGCLAVKEAVVKVVDPPVDTAWWSGVEVVGQPPAVSLSGSLAAAAASLTGWRLSLSVGGELAAAVVMAHERCAERER